MTERYNYLSAWPGDTIENYVDRCLHSLRHLQDLKVFQYNEIVSCIFNDIPFCLDLYDTVETGIKKYYNASKEMNKLCSMTGRVEFRNEEGVKILRVQKISRLLCSFDTLILDSKDINQMRRVLNWIKNYIPYMTKDSKDLDSNMYVYKILSSYDFVETHIGLSSETEENIYKFYRYLVERFMDALRLHNDDKDLIELIEDWKKRAKKNFC